MLNNVINQATGNYLTDDEIIKLALSVMSHRFGLRRPAMSSPQAVRDYLNLSLSDKEHEVFVVIFLDAQNCVIAIEEMFRGTLSQTSVYPREVVKQALHHNCASVIFAHNHPSGNDDPSTADEMLTKTLKDALSMFDIKTLDHFIVAQGKTMSFAERGLI